MTKSIKSTAWIRFTHAVQTHRDMNTVHGIISYQGTEYGVVRVDFVDEAAYAAFILAYGD